MKGEGELRIRVTIMDKVCQDLVAERHSVAEAVRPARGERLRACGWQQPMGIWGFVGVPFVDKANE